MSSLFKQFGWSAMVFPSRTRPLKAKDGEPKYFAEEAESSSKHFRGRFFARTYFLRLVRVLIAQSIRARTSSGAKKKSLNGDLPLFFFPLFFLFFFFLVFSISVCSRESPLWQRSIDFADQCKIAAFATRKLLETTTTGNFKYRVLFLKSSVRKDWIPSSCPFSTHSWRSQVGASSLKANF